MKHENLIGKEVSNLIKPIFRGTLTGVTEDNKAIINSEVTPAYITAFYEVTEIDRLLESLFKSDWIALECDCEPDWENVHYIVAKLMQENHLTVVQKLVHACIWLMTERETDIYHERDPDGSLKAMGYPDHIEKLKNHMSHVNNGLGQSYLKADLENNFNKGINSLSEAYESAKDAVHQNVDVYRMEPVLQKIAEMRDAAAVSMQQLYIPNIYK